MDLQLKYQKYKTKYIELKKSSLEGGGKKLKKKSKKKNVIINSSMGIPNYIETLSEPWFTLISLGLKTIEGRINNGRFKNMNVGDIVEWTNDNFKPRSVMTRITRKAEYSTFSDYLETEGLEKCLPGMTDLESGLSVYYKYFTKEDEEKFGVVVIEIELIK